MARDEGRQKIIEALDHHFVRAMRNWARWSAGSSMGYAQSSAYDGVIGDGWDGSGIPLLEGEAKDVQAAMGAIDRRYSHAVRLFWEREGESLPRLARRCRLEMDYRTFQTWVMRGHDLLKVEMHRRRAQMDRTAHMNRVLTC